jgi:peptide/nickel transport system substrate-binding protein
MPKFSRRAVLTTSRTRIAVAGLLSTALVTAACTSKSAVTGGSSAPASDGGLASENINATGTPVSGGTLDMLGVGDVDFMDPNVSYYSGGYLGLRLWSRQLVTYPAIAGKATTVVPDLATQLPTVANGGVSKDGLTYKFTIRTGAMWNTTPARQVTAADMVRGMKRVCNPAQPFGGLPDADRRPRRLLHGLREGRREVGHRDGRVPELPRHRRRQR